ncbi:MAG TPA: class I SAM-dependent methyltransferase [Vicinamibacteria bacterium]|nr:class I SAM-dependent methyltransferase [Vicinamibacteria bacterium]
MERLALDRFASPWLRNQHLARYHWAAGFATGKDVLDAACGSGYGSLILRDGGARRVTSVDRSPESFAISPRPSRAIRGDVTRLPLASGCVDLYVCFETLEHVEDDASLLREARRVLAPGGLFLCSTPNRDLLSPGHTLADRPRNPYHLREYSIIELEGLLSGFFPRVSLLGQTWFSDGHSRRLAWAGARSPHAAVRLQQLRNLASLPWETLERHQPRPLGEAGVPEVVIGVCSDLS